MSSSARELIRLLLTSDPTQRITASSALRHPWLLKQYSIALDMNKLRFDTTVLISNRPEDDLDDQVMSELEIFGLAKEEMIRLIMTKTHSSIATLYYLLLDNIVNRRRKEGGARRAVSASSSSSSQHTHAHSNSNFNPPTHITKSIPYLQTNVQAGRPGTANATAVNSSTYANSTYLYDAGGAPAQGNYQYVLQQPHQQQGLQQQG